jgi:hypothetical protein
MLFTHAGCPPRRTASVRKDSIHMFTIDKHYARMLRFNSSPSPPLDFGHRLTLTFYLECIALRRPSNWLH